MPREAWPALVQLAKTETRGVLHGSVMLPDGNQTSLPAHPAVPWETWGDTVPLWVTAAQGQKADRKPPQAASKVSHA